MIPQDEEIRRRIHKMIEYVVREGPGFESAIIAREFHNPLFRFLLDYTSPEVCSVIATRSCGQIVAVCSYLPE